MRVRKFDGKVRVAVGITTIALMTVALGATRGQAQTGTGPAPGAARPKVLAAATQARVALSSAPSPELLSTLAQVNERTVDEITKISKDPSMWFDSTGQLYVIDNEPVPPAPPVSPSNAKTSGVAAYPTSQTFLLHSKPGSLKTIYLDFDGQVVPPSAWSASTITAAPFSLDANPLDWSAEHSMIQGIYDRVSEDYAPFDVDVTTQLPPLAKITRTNLADQQYGIRAVITNMPASTICGGTGCGGVAFLGTFDLPAPNDSKYQPAWIFPGSLSNDEKDIAEAISHEVGHNLNLLHDGRTIPPEDYYYGANSWAPIMGVGYNQPIVQFSNGDYVNGSNTLDDFTVMSAKGLAIRADEAGETNATALPLCNKGNVVAAGVIAGRTDADWFSFSATAGWTVNVSAAAAVTSPDLDIELKLHNSVGTGPTANPVSATSSSDIATGMGASISYVIPATGTYYVKVDGAGRAGSYSDYGSVGRYRLTVTKPAPNIPCVTLNTAVKNTAPPLG
jgi:Bacterial pre-peptidase C-terminal domain